MSTVYGKTKRVGRHPTAAQRAARRPAPAAARFVPSAKIPAVIPPRSVVVLRSFDPRLSPAWRGDLGRVFRVGYYSQQDGLDCVWLVNERGEYEQTTDRTSLLRHFFIKLSDEKDLFGDAATPLKSLPRKRPSPFARYVTSGD